MPEEGNTPPPSLRELLADAGAARLGALLDEPEVHAAVLRALADIGCRPPANHLVLFGLRKTFLATGNFLGRAAASRIEELLQRIPAVRKLLTTLAALDRQEADKDALRSLLLEKLNHRRDVNEGPTVDESTSLEVLSALYQTRQLDGLSDHFTDLLGSLQIAIRDIVTSIDVADNEPVLGWSRQIGPTTDRSISDTLRYNSGQYIFVGRDREMDFLCRFLGDVTAAGPLARFSWLLVTAPGGEGKSRLALEFADHAREHLGWNIGRITHSALTKFDPSRWSPRSPTCIIIDYPAQVPQQVNAMLAGLQQRSPDFDWPCRVLLLERDAFGDWFDRLLPPDSTSSAIRAHAHRHDGERLDDGWDLPPMAPQSIVAVMAERIRSEGVEPPSDELLFLAARRIDDRVTEIDELVIPIPRPLFAMAAAEALLLARKASDASYATLVERLDRKEVLGTLIHRDRTKRWQLTGKGSDPQTLMLHEALYALATFSLGLSRGKLRELPASVRTWLPDLEPKGPVPLDNKLLEVMCGSLGDHIPELEPDILGEFYVLEYLTTHKDAIQPICDGAFAADGMRAGFFLLRCFIDFPERIFGLGYLAPSEAAGVGAIRNFAKTCTDMSGFLGEARDWTQIDALIERLNVLRRSETLKRDREIAVSYASVAFNVVQCAAVAGEWDRVDSTFHLLETLRRSDALREDRKIAILVAKAATHTASHSIVVGHWTRVEAMFKHLLTERAHGFLQEDQQLAHAEARVTATVIHYAVKNDDWTRVDSALEHLDTLRKSDAFADDVEIATFEARAMVSISRTSDWARLDAAVRRLDILRETDAFRMSREIAQADAKVACRIIDEAAKAALWERADIMLRRLTALRASELFHDDVEIARLDAFAAASIIACTEPGNTSRIDAMLQRLDIIRAQGCFRDDREIALREAEAAVKLVSRDPQTRGDAVLERLQSLREQPIFRDDHDLALMEANAIFTASNRIAELGQWARVSDLFDRLETLLNNSAFPNDLPIAVATATMARNVCYDAAATNEWSQVDIALNRLDSLRHREPFRDNVELFLEHARALVNVFHYADKSGNDERADVVFAHLGTLRRHSAFANNREVALNEANMAFTVVRRTGTAHNWLLLDSILERFETLRKQSEFQNDHEVLLVEAKAVFIIIRDAATDSQWERADTLLNRLDTLRRSDTFHHDCEIVGAEVEAALSLIHLAGAVAQWAYVDAAYSIIDSLRQIPAFQTISEVALREASALTAGITPAAAAAQWTRVGLILTRFDALINSEALTSSCETRDVALTVATAIFNVLYLASSAKQWPLVDAALACVDSLRAREFLREDPAIAQIEAEAALHIIPHAAMVGHWSLVKAMEHRTMTLAKLFLLKEPQFVACASEALLVGYYQRRSSGLEPDELESVVASRAAICIFDLQTLMELDQSRIDLALQVMKDARTRFPQTAEIVRMYEQFAQRGINFDAL